MLHLTVSNRLETLADALAEHLEAKPLADPLLAEHIVVPHSGIGRWLQLRLAQRWGVAAQLRFDLPAQAVGHMLAAFSAAQSNDGDADAWERGALRWRLLDLLHALPAERSLAPLREYLGDDPDPLKPWQLACRLADVFDAYQVYRPDWLDAWSIERRVLPDAPDEAWQAALWRHLRRDLPGPDRGARLLALIAAIEAHEGPADALPPRLNLFGALPLSPVQMRWVAALAGMTDVAVFHCAPSSAFWADLRSPREQARARRRGQSDDEALPPAVELLTSLGARARETQTLQIEHWLDHSIERECWVAPDAGHPLGWLQAAMLELDAGPPPLPATLSSLRVHACANPRREVEVLLDALLDLFQRDPSLRPNDVAIMAPSLDRYAPLIEAVLAATPPERRLPVTFADRRADRVHPLIQRFLWLLRLPQASFSRTEVLGLLDCVQVRSRFELSEEGLGWLHAWTGELGVVRGLDAAQREALGEGALHAHTWAAAVERLLMGQAAGDDGSLLDGVAPFAGGDDGEAAVALGALWQLLRALDRWRRALGETPPPLPACERLRQLFDAFFRVEGGDQAAADAESAIRDALETIEQQIVLGEAVAATGFEAPIAALEEALAQPSRWQRFLGDGATVCALVPLRSVPFRVIAVLGLDDGAFPRRQSPAGFDLLPQAPRAGDRRPREDDRQLLLDTLLAARDHLHLSYVGNDPVDGAERPPAPPLAEIVDALRRAYALLWPQVEACFLCRHPLPPFAAASFSADTGSFAAQWWPALAAERAGWREPAPFFTAPLAGDFEERVEPEQLIAFYRHPARILLGTRLGLGRASWIEDEADEPQAVGRREDAALLQRLLQASAEGRRLDELIVRIRAEGNLPAGLAGERALAELHDRFLQALDLLPSSPRRHSGESRNPPCSRDESTMDSGFRRNDEQERAATSMEPRLPPGDLRRLSIAAEFELHGLHLSGELSCWVSGDEPLTLGTREPGAIDLLTLALLREMGARQGLLSATATCLYLEAEPGKRPRRHLLAPLADPDAWLEDLAAGWRSGLRTPLPLPAQSGWAYACGNLHGDAHEAALAGARAAWEGSERARGEAQDSDHAIAFRGIDLPALPAFADWAMRIYGPLAAALSTERRR